MPPSPRHARPAEGPIAPSTSRAHGLSRGATFRVGPATGAAERAATLEALHNQARAVVLLEAPHRMEALAQALAVWGARAVTIGRELTKQFEDIHTLPAAEIGRAHV